MGPGPTVKRTPSLYVNISSRLVEARIALQSSVNAKMKYATMEDGIGFFNALYQHKYSVPYRYPRNVKRSYTTAQEPQGTVKKLSFSLCCRITAGLIDKTTTSSHHNNSLRDLLRHLQIRCLKHPAVDVANAQFTYSNHEFHRYCLYCSVQCDNVMPGNWIGLQLVTLSLNS